jgi:Flp pilus assembly protein TadD
MAALAEKLESHPALRPAYGPLVVPPSLPQPYGPLDVLRVARAAQARFVLVGGYARPRWRLSFEVKLLEVSGDRVAHIAKGSAQGGASDYFAVLDAALEQVLAATDLMPSPDVWQRMRRPPSTDHYAFVLYGRGLSALAAVGRPRDLELAEQNLRRAVFINPRYAEAHRLLGRLLAEKGERARARFEYSYALDLRPDYHPAVVGLLELSRGERDLGRSLELARRALELRPADGETRFVLGQILWEMGKVEDAGDQLGRLLADEPDHLGARRIMVLVSAARGDNAELARQLEKVVSLAPRDIETRLDLAAAYRQLDRAPQAELVYRSILERSPRQLQALKFLGDLRREQGDPASAIPFYERVHRLSPADPRLYFLLGASYLATGQVAKAERIYLAAQRFSRYQAHTQNNLGVIYLNRGELERALAALGSAVTAAPRRPRLHYNLALVYSALGQRERSLAELRTAAALDGRDPDIRYNLGVALLRMGRLGEAEAAFREAVALRPDHADALHNLSVIAELRRGASELDERPAAATNPMRSSTGNAGGVQGAPLVGAGRAAGQPSANGGQPPQGRPRVGPRVEGIEGD